MANIKSNLFLNYVYQILNIIIPFVLTPYLTRTIGSSGLGSYSYYYACANYFTLFSMLGITLYGNRSIAKVEFDREKRTQTFWEIYFVQIISSLIVCVCYCIYVIFFAQNKILSWIFLLYVIAYLFDINWFYFGIENFKTTISRNLMIKIMTIIFVFLFVKKEQDINIYAFGFSFGTLISNIVLFIGLSKFINLPIVKKLKLCRHFKSILIFFIPVITVSVYRIMDKIMLGAISGMNEVGFYESCERVVNFPMAFTSALGTVMLPRISNLVSTNNEEKIEGYLNTSLKIALFVTSAMCFGIMAVADIFVPIFYGDGFDKCSLLLTILMISCLFLAFAQNLKTHYLIPHDMEKIYIISAVFGAITNFVLNAMLIPYLASVGAAIGTVMAEMAVWIYQCWTLRKKLPIMKYFCDVLPYIISGGIMFWVVRNTADLWNTSAVVFLVIKVVEGIIIYLGCATLFEIIKRKVYKQ
ncbi:MAG: flippase [Alistipes sp.]|nr:flippase [Alistipes sp.]